MALMAFTFVTYQPVGHAGFIWDDEAYVTDNPLLTAPDGFKRIWFSKHSQSQYFPLVYTTLRFEHMLWGLNPAGYHVVNVLLHSLNALLVWAALRRLAVPGAWLAAAIWAAHPVNVESVAWVTELKNAQSTLFYLLALLAWMKFADRETVRRWRFYALALLLHALALFSKTTACTLPAAMLLVLWVRKEPIGWRRCVQVAPFLVFGVLMGLVSVWWEAHLGNYGEEFGFSFSGLGRLLIATRALWFYVGKLAWPANLTFSYARWEINPRDPLQYMWLIGCVGVALFLWWRRNALGRAPVAAVVFFVAALSPLLGFIPLYTFRFSFVADHYQYVASIGLIALFTAAASSRAMTWQVDRSMRISLSFLVLLVLGTLTWRRAGIYRDAETLWRDTLTKNPGCWLAHNNLGTLLVDKGKVQEAIGQYEQALRLKPDYAEAHNNLGMLLWRAGRIQEVIEHFEQVLRLRPGSAEAHNNLGVVLGQGGRTREAIGQYEQALRIKPDYADAHYNLGAALEQTDRVQEAIGQYEQALRIKPDYAEAHNDLGIALRRLGRIQEAIGHYEQALRINPDFAEAHNNLGVVLQQADQMQEAIGHYEQALRLKPDYAEAHNNLGNALLQAGRLEEAIGHLEQALRIKPDYAEAHCNLGVALEQTGRVQEAIGHYEQALRIKPDYAEARAKLQLARQALTKLQEHGASGQR